MWIATHIAEISFMPISLISFHPVNWEGRPNERWRNGLLAMQSLPPRKRTLVEHLCSVCGSTFTVTPSDLRYRLKISKDGNLFCSRSCSFASIRSRNARLKGVILKRQSSWTEEQYAWEQILHNMGFGTRVASIRNPVDLVAVHYSLRREGKWWETDGHFGTTVNPIRLDDGTL
jgi:hypothetical protein